jgi:hypothetical protein
MPVPAAKAGGQPAADPRAGRGNETLACRPSSCSVPSWPVRQLEQGRSLQLAKLAAVLNRDRLLEGLARAISLVATIIALIISIGIVFRVLGGNRANDLVAATLDAAKALVGPFDRMFTPKSAKLGVAVSWGVAIVVYLLLGSFLSKLVLRLRRGSG